MPELKHADINKILNTRKRKDKIKNVYLSERWLPQIQSINWITEQTINRLINSLNTKAKKGLKLLKSPDKETRDEVRHERRKIEEIQAATCVLKGFNKWYPNSELSKYLLEVAPKREFQFPLTKPIPTLDEFKRLVNKKSVCFFKAIGRFYKNQWKEEGTLYLGKDEKNDLQLNAEKALTEAIANSSSILVDYNDNMEYVIDGENGNRVVMTKRAAEKYIENYLVK